MGGKRELHEWISFGAVSLIWASAYAMTRGAVFGDEGLPVPLVIFSRLAIGAIVLNIVMFTRGLRYPPPSDRKKWGAMLGMGFLGMTGPFFIIAIAQQTVDSSLAALYVAATPIFIVLGANFLFDDEKLTSRIAIGIGMGFFGVAALFGPEVYQSFGSANATAHLLLLISAVLYASSTLLARASPKITPLVFASGFVSLAAVMALPMLFLVDWEVLSVTRGQMLNVIGLGVGPSAIASILYMSLVQRSGATFLALTGYLVPVLSAIIGFVLFREVFSWNAAFAFVLILSGVWLAQSRKPAKA